MARIATIPVCGSLALLLACVVLAGCGGTASTGRFGEVALNIEAAPGADEAGVYFATARGFDEAEGVELEVTREAAPIFGL